MIELLGGLFLGSLLFGSSCHCASCLKARKKASREYAKWCKENAGRSASTSVSVSTSPSASTRPSI